MRVLVVGAGFSGATIARVLAEHSIEVDVIDRRSHLAGNAYDYVDAHGIRVHAYGPHLFHTSNEKVVEFLSRFTRWLPYKHKVKAMLSDGRLVTFPVNRETALIVGYDRVIDVFYRPYTLKMWGVELDRLDPDILKRVPIRDDLNEYYFPSDSFQALPEGGYTRLVENMLDHARINVRLNCIYDNKMNGDYCHVFNSMSIDEFFDFDNGMLPYRSIRFETYVLPTPMVYPVATVNFTHSEKYTRVTEWKNLPGHGDSASHTALTFEMPCDFRDNNYERYYPVKDLENNNRALYDSYRSRVASNITFIGRCGLYAYLDMHQAVSAAQAIANNFIQNQSD